MYSDGELRPVPTMKRWFASGKSANVTFDRAAERRLPLGEIVHRHLIVTAALQDQHREVERRGRGRRVVIAQIDEVQTPAH